MESSDVLTGRPVLVSFVSDPEVHIEIHRESNEMGRFDKKFSKMAELFFFFLAILVVFGFLQKPSGAQNLSEQAEDAGKSVEKSINNAAKKTGDYLKSDSFDQEVKRVVDGAGKAIKNAGNWIGDKIDSISKKGSQK